MKKVYRNTICITMVICVVIFSCLSAGAASLTVTSHFKILTSPTFSIQYSEMVDPQPITSAHTIYHVYRMESFPITGSFTFDATDDGYYHYTTGEALFNLQLAVSGNNNSPMNIKFDFHPVVSDSLITAYNANTYGQSTDKMRLCCLFSNFYTYGTSELVPLGSVDIEITLSMSSELQPPATLSITPSLTSISGGVLYHPNTPDPFSSIAGQIQAALDTDGNISDIVSYLSSIASTDQYYLAQILSSLNLTRQYVMEIRAYNYDIYRLLVEYFEHAGESEASEAQSEATEQQEEMSRVAESIEVDEPSLDDAMESLDDELAGYGPAQQDLFYWLRGNNNVIVTILILCFGLALCGYVLYGRM